MSEQSRLSISINIEYVKNWGALLTFVKALNPFAITAVIDTKNAMPRVHELRQALPNAIIVVRCVIVVDDSGNKKELDGGMHLAPQSAGDTRRYIVSPGDFLNEWGELGKGGFILSYMNEPQTTDATPENIARQVHHMIETIGLANQRSIALCVGNWGVGQDPDNDAFMPVFELLSANRQHILGLHLYAPIDTYQAIERIINRCKNRNSGAIKPPRIHVNEFGWDTAGNGDPLNGFKSRMTSAAFADWCEDKIKNVLRPYIESGVVEVVEVFGFGYAVSFPNDDVENEPSWQSPILAAAAKGDLTINTTTKPATPPYASGFVANAVYKLAIAGAYRNVRDRAGQATGVFVGQLDNGATFTAIEEKIADSDYWWHIKTDTVDGWMSLSGGNFKAIRQVTSVTTTNTTPNTPPMIINIPPPTSNVVDIPSMNLGTTPPPPVIPPPVIALPPPAVANTVYMMTAEERAQALTYLLGLTNLLMNAQETTVTSEPVTKAA